MTQRLCHKCNQVPLIIGLAFGEHPMLELCGECLKQFAEETGPFWLDGKAYCLPEEKEKLRAAIERIQGARELAQAMPSGTA
jgi:hypothetical protein